MACVSSCEVDVDIITNDDYILTGVENISAQMTFFTLQKKKKKEAEKSIKAPPTKYGYSFYMNFSEMY